MEITKEQIEKMVREVMTAQLGEAKKTVDPSGIISWRLPEFQVTEEDRLDTGNPEDVVYCKDLVTLEESPRLGIGLMVMKDTTFEWELQYDEVDYIIDGHLDVLIDGRKISAAKDELMFIPTGSKIQFSVTGEARFIYVTFPADWQNQ